MAVSGRATVLRTTALVEAPVGTVRRVADGLATSVRLLGRSYPVRVDLSETGAGTLLTCSLSWRRFGEVLDALLWRRRVLRALTRMTHDIRDRSVTA
jgi:hypothetical protein